jgi:hypothetical protein
VGQRHALPLNRKSTPAFTLHSAIGNLRSAAKTLHSMQVLDCAGWHVVECRDRSSLPRRIVLGCNYNFLLDLDRPEVLSITDCVQGVTEKEVSGGIRNRGSREHKATGGRVVRQQKEGK